VTSATVGLMIAYWSSHLRQRAPQPHRPWGAHRAARSSATTGSAAWQEPNLFTTEVRAAFRSLRWSAPPATEVVMSRTVETASDIRPFHVDIPRSTVRCSPSRP